MIAENFAGLQENLENEARLLSEFRLLIAKAGIATILDELATCESVERTANSLACANKRISRSTIAARIALVGDFSAGKSTFVNTLLGDANLCPQHDQPTTSSVTTFLYGPEERIFRHDTAGRPTKIDRTTYHRLVQRPYVKGRNGGGYRFSFYYPNSLLLGIELLDTPGFNNPRNPNDSTVTLEATKDADAFLFLHDATSGAISKSSVERIGEIRALAPSAAAFMVLSKAEQKAPDDLSAIKAAIMRKHAGLFSKTIYAWSNLGKQGREDIDSHAEVEDLFNHTRAFVCKRAVGRHLGELRAHQDIRGMFAINLRSKLRAWAARKTQFIELMRERQNEASLLLDDVQIGTAAGYARDFQRALSLGTSVHEVKGTGLFFCDAMIVYSPQSFQAAMQAFESITSMREHLCRCIARGMTKADGDNARAAVESMVTLALDETTKEAAALVATLFSHFKSGPYGSLREARKALIWEFLPHAGKVSDALWDSWILWISGLHNHLTEEYFAPAVSGEEAMLMAVETWMGAYESTVSQAAALLQVKE